MPSSIQDDNQKEHTAGKLGLTENSET